MTRRIRAYVKNYPFGQAHFQPYFEFLCGLNLVNFLAPNSSSVGTDTTASYAIVRQMDFQGAHRPNP